MAQSLNTSVEYKTKAVSYLGIGGKVGHILLGDKALNFITIKMSMTTSKFPGQPLITLVPMSQEKS